VGVGDGWVQVEPTDNELKDYPWFVGNISRSKMEEGMKGASGEQSKFDQPLLPLPSLHLHMHTTTMLHTPTLTTNPLYITLLVFFLAFLARYPPSPPPHSLSLSPSSPLLAPPRPSFKVTLRSGTAAWQAATLSQCGPTHTQCNTH
jgi:hypothetical protein